MAVRAELSSLRVLLPRPRKDRDMFAQQLELFAGVAHRLPVLAIVPLLESARQNAEFVAELACHSHIIFVSPTAAELTLSALEGKGRLPSSIKLYAVGQATADLLCNAGYQVIYPVGDATSEGLLQQAQELVDVVDHKILICRGRDGRTKLYDTLEARGAQVRFRDIYLRQPITDNSEQINQLIGTGQIDVVAVHSGAIFLSLWALLSEENRTKFQALPLLVPGERVADIVRQQNCVNLIIAASALAHDMVDGLLHWYTQQKA